MNRFLFLLLVLITIPAAAQRKMSAAEYIAMYKDLAIEKMSLYGIPASISLSQGLLESGNGGSELAVKANNHFGIKCGKDWRGERVYHDDDSAGECFRAYRTVDESYRDHSHFLTRNQRYASLFKLDKLDYKAWAHGLKEAGYATNPKYPELLIGVIEKNGLYKYDIPQNLGGLIGQHIFIGEGNAPKADRKTGRIWGHTNRVKYIIAESGDNFAHIAEASGVSIEKLLKLNDLPTTIPLKDGDKIYLKAKKGKSKFVSTYQVQPNQSARDIAQKFGIKERALKRLNKELKHSEPKTGQIVLLR